MYYDVWIKCILARIYLMCDMPGEAHHHAQSAFKRWNNKIEQNKSKDWSLHPGCKESHEEMVNHVVQLALEAMERIGKREKDVKEGDKGEVTEQEKEEEDLEDGDSARRISRMMKGLEL
ncbi:hypothetical protein QFC20_005248 [Naganishia adeliensis]|uniref:Uncharacterized protein n=1 Tax=Naganishia adeliensis TaxID=92952 RepID=A0ACC2VR34_9TREE|nr:hypothetical protein QFC20_005248 [Naganishia adeliensis]